MLNRHGKRDILIKDAIIEGKFDMGPEDKGFIIDGRDCYIDIPRGDITPSCFYNTDKGDKVLLSIDNATRKTAMAKAKSLDDRCEIKCNTH